jgi:hypothetical protein
MAAVLFVQGLGVRPEIVDAMQKWRFTAKLGIVVASFVVALWVAMHLARPDADQPKALATLLLPMIMLSAAIAWEMAISPEGTWSIWAVGSNSRICRLYRRAAFRAGHRRDRQASDSRSDRRGVGLRA